MNRRVNQLLRDARGKETSDIENDSPLRPGFPERVLLARDENSRRKRQVRAVILSGSLAGAALSVAVAVVVNRQVHEQRMVEAAEVWGEQDDTEGGLE